MLVIVEIAMFVLGVVALFSGRLNAWKLQAEGLAARLAGLILMSPIPVAAILIGKRVSRGERDIKALVGIEFLTIMGALGLATLVCAFLGEGITLEMDGIRL